MQYASDLQEFMLYLAPLIVLAAGLVGGYLLVIVLIASVWRAVRE